MAPYVAGVVLLAVGVFARLPDAVAAVAAGAGIVLVVVYAMLALRRSAIGPAGRYGIVDGADRRTYQGNPPPHGHGYPGHGHGGGHRGGGDGGGVGGFHGGHG